MTNVFGEMVTKRTGELCFNSGWSTEDILATVELSMKFKDCYKVLIQSLTDYSNWTGKYAKLLDKCSDSDDEDITVYTWNPIPADQTTYIYGDSSFTQCSPGKLFSPNVHSMLFNTLSAVFGKPEAMI